mmetsp:Transcript_47680/g.136635  ORF Transcript_47680/g.136635 Transcript_47680/m.136635 type:complete len:324 (+) Transcript_47680:1202-2173(+)
MSVFVPPKEPGIQRHHPVLATLPSTGVLHHQAVGVLKAEVGGERPEQRRQLLPRLPGGGGLIHEFLGGLAEAPEALHEVEFRIRLQQVLHAALHVLVGRRSRVLVGRFPLLGRSLREAVHRRAERTHGVSDSLDDLGAPAPGVAIRGRHGIPNGLVHSLDDLGALASKSVPLGRLRLSDTGLRHSDGVGLGAAAPHGRPASSSDATEPSTRQGQRAQHQQQHACSSCPGGRRRGSAAAGDGGADRRVHTGACGRTWAGWAVAVPQPRSVPLAPDPADFRTEGAMGSIAGEVAQLQHRETEPASPKPHCPTARHRPWGWAGGHC